MQRLQLAFASMEEDTGRILFMPDASYYEVRAGAPLVTIASETGFSSDDYTVKLAEAEAFYFAAGLVDPIFGYPLSSQRTMVQYHDQPSTDRSAHERRIKYVVSEGELESEHTVAYLVRYRSESYAANSGPPIEKWFTVTFTAPEGANPGAAANVSIKGLLDEPTVCGITTSGNELHLNPPPIQNGKNELHLLPVEVATDINNDGQTNSSDSGLAGAAYTSGASDDAKDKATEFMFANDQLSNGAWDKEDTTTPGVPGTADDDDAEEIMIKPGITEGEVWLDHPAIAGMKFYKQRKCTEEIQLSPSSHFTISSSNPFPDKVFMRAESVTFSSTTNPQVEGDLKLMIKPTGGAVAGIEAAKMKLTIIKDIGATKYFHGARDYMLEQNARLHARFFNAGSHQIRITAMRHESTDMGVIETYHRNPKIYGMPDVVAKNQDHYDLILNGNFCFFDGGTAGRLWGIANHQMTPRCHGGCVVGGAQNAATSVGGSNPFEQPNAEYLSANGKGTFAIATGVVPLTPPAHQAALGGFASNLVGGTYNIHPWFGLAETGSATDKKKLIFTVTQTAATTQYPVADLAARLTASGQTLCVAGDGGSSTAIAHRIEGDSTRVKFAGGKHYAGHYWINTYVGFKSDKPRP
jgi:hypothetical protein